jgi:hypothetical protein
MFPKNQLPHALRLTDAAPGVHPAKAPRVAANITKLPELARG